MNFGNGMGMGLGFMASVFWPFMIWAIFIKGIALWHAARKGHEWWFIALVVINTVGILELIYLFGILKLKPQELFKK